MKRESGYETVSEKRFNAFARSVCVYDFRRALFALFIIELSFSFVVLFSIAQFQVSNKHIHNDRTYDMAELKMENELAIVYYTDIHIYLVWLIHILAKAHLVSLFLFRSLCVKNIQTHLILRFEHRTRIPSIDTNKANKFNSHKYFTLNTRARTVYCFERKSSTQVLWLAKFFPFIRIFRFGFYYTLNNDDTTEIVCVRHITISVHIASLCQF